MDEAAIRLEAAAAELVMAGAVAVVLELGSVSAHSALLSALQVGEIFEIRGPWIAGDEALTSVYVHRDAGAAGNAVGSPRDARTVCATLGAAGPGS
jgi:hypothetical protein